MRTLVIWLLLTSMAEAACVAVPAATVPRAHRQAVAYRLAFLAGHDEVPTDGQGRPIYSSPINDICFATFNPAGVITDSAMTTEYQNQVAANQSADQAEATRQQGFESEITANDLCTAELTDIVSRVETRRTTLRSQVEAQRVTNNSTITNAANNIAGVKSAMTTLNNVTAAEFNATVDELASLATKIAKCLRARAR